MTYLKVSECVRCDVTFNASGEGLGRGDLELFQPHI